MSDFRNTKRLNYAEIENLIDYPISEGQTYFAKDAGVFFKDIHGQRFATLEVDSLDNLNDPDFFIGAEDESNGTKEKLKGRILLIKIAGSDAYEWYYIHPEDGQIIPLSTTDRLSAGVYRKPTIDVDLYPGSQEFTVSDCSVNLFATENHLGQIKRYTLAPKTWTEADGEWPEIGKTRYVVANYNGGSPKLQIINSVTSINESNIVPVFTIVRTLNNIHYIGWDQLGAGLANKMHARFVKTQRFVRESGLSLSSTFIETNQSYTWASGATLNTFTGKGYDIKISSGVVWNGAVRTTLDAVDSKVDQLRFYFHDTNGNWTYTNTNTIINRRQYDKLTTGGSYVGLTDLETTAKYGVAWIYRGVLVDNYIGYVLSNNDYTKTEAINSTPPAMLPDILQNLSMLIGKVVFSYMENEDIGDVQVINITGVGGGVSGGSGGVVGDQNLLTTSSPTFVGLTVNSLVLKGTSFNTTLTKTEPTAARTITFPNAGGTVVLSDGAVTNGFVPVWNGTTGGLLGDGYKVQDSSANAALSTNADLVTERDVYYGLIRVNNSTQTRANIIYAPTTGGTLGYTLIGAGATSAPTWTNLLFHDTANSRVGVGTVAPTKLLDVNGEARVRNQLTVDSIMTIGNLIIQDTAPADPNRGYIDIKLV